MKTGMQSVVLLSAAIILGGCAGNHLGPQSQKYTAEYNAAGPTPAPSETWTFEPIVTEYNEQKSPAWNFASTLHSTVLQCARQASSGNLLYGVMRSTGNTSQPDEYAQSLEDCHKFAYGQGSEAVNRLKQENVSSKTQELAKDLYTKWLTYLGTMSVYTPKNTAAELQFDTALRALRTEDQFSR